MITVSTFFIYLTSVWFYRARRIVSVRSSGRFGILGFRGLSVIGVQMSLQVKYRQTIGQIEFTLGQILPILPILCLNVPFMTRDVIHGPFPIFPHRQITRRLKSFWFMIYKKCFVCISLFSLHFSVWGLK